MTAKAGDSLRTAPYVVNSNVCPDRQIELCSSKKKYKKAQQVSREKALHKTEKNWEMLSEVVVSSLLSLHEELKLRETDRLLVAVSSE